MWQAPPTFDVTVDYHQPVVDEIHSFEELAGKVASIFKV